ncbi:MAG: glycosyltransferase [Candidatus Hydrogenedentota bacterium]
MLEGYNILAFTYANWHANWSAPQQIMARLAPENRVLFVDTPRSFLYWLRPRDPAYAVYRDAPHLEEVSENIFVYHPRRVFAPVGRLPFPLARQSLRINGRIMAAMVHKQMRVLGMRRRPILWNFSPIQSKAIPYIQRRLTIYDICDEWAHYVKHVSGKMVLGWAERALCRSADLVFTNTESAKEKRAALNPETHVVHNGADFVHFSKAAASGPTAPEEVSQLQRPRIGYVGVIDPMRFDADLVLHIARARPDWSILLVGPLRHDMDRTPFDALPNIHLTGHKTIEELPNYLSAMDALILPALLNEATRNIYPLKLHEYLATGKPIVSTPLPALEPYAAVLEFATAPAEFVAAIDDALAQGNTPEKTTARQAVARENSWTHRVAEKSAHVERMLHERKESIGARI